MQQSSPDIITFGESMALFMPEEHRALERAATLEQSFGGAESNVAIGVARLGVSSGWFGTLGDDPFGKMILKALRAEGVDVSRARLSGEAPTGLMFREKVAGRVSVHYYRKHSAASRMTEDQLDEAYIRGAKILHVTGITAALSENCRRTVRRAIGIAKDAGVKVCFDPNLRLKLWTIEEAREALLPLAAEADYFLPGWDELKLLYDTDDYDKVKDELASLRAVTVIKGRGDNTVVLDNGAETVVPFYPAEQVIDTVGAGDGFCAGFLAGLVKGMSPHEAVRLASVNGSLVVQMRGDWEALPEWSAVEQRLGNKAWVER
ncbi:sugar kinase [Paenibacillus thailandensis]|uniref:Sugar kinase n=1 Tax=Paenibacillus thailandensis TaxID=393250 RepID=A0ABW5QRH2_9BACL